jgi:hypothetical protein
VVCALAIALAGCGSPASPAGPPVFYLFSVLNDFAPVGPQTYLSDHGKTLSRLTNRGANIVPHIWEFRDARFLHVGDRYYYSFTHGGRSSRSIGLMGSGDLQKWTSIATPKWDRLYRGRENAVWNGAWWNDNGTYYMFFGVCKRSVPLCKPYVVQFIPGSDTFGAPQPIVFTTSSPHRYAIVMAVFQIAGTNWALLQTMDATGNSVVALASFTTLSAPWTTDWKMMGDQPGYRESGAAIVLPNGDPRVYYVETGGGELFYTTASGPDLNTATWSAPQAIAPFQDADQPADWVDVVPISDFQTLQDIASLSVSTQKITAR